MSADQTPLYPPILMLPPEPSSPGAPVPIDLDDRTMMSTAPSCTGLARGQREQRPKRRPCVNYGLKLAGHSVHIGVGFRSAGTVLEFFVDLHKEGAPLRAAAHVVATIGSMALQRGMSLGDLCSGLRSMYAEPAGEVEGHDRITSALSLFDLVAKVLEDAEMSGRAIT